MILEVAPLQIRAGQEAAFEAAFNVVRRGAAVHRSRKADADGERRARIVGGRNAAAALART